MIELLIFGAGAAVGALALALPYHRAVTDRDVLQAAKDSLAVDVEALSNRATVLRGDNIAQQAQIDLLRTGHDRLVDERDALKRELGRIKAEKVAMKPKRDSKTGRFVSKKPAAVTPISCG